VAVVQISRIQHRRGQKNTGSGLPQLASGELGWAIDTRELYIGNGAVSEGAPAVGNTKILTEFDDLFTLARSYTYLGTEGYLNTGPDSASPVNRTLQERLDDRVSVKSFGARGDGITDDTEAFQRAIDQLYVNSATKSNPQSRVVLHVEAGTYRITDTLYIPPFATVHGAGIDKTIVKQITDVPIIRTVNGSSEPGSPADDSSSSFENQARKISMSGMTLEHTHANTGLLLESCRESHFENIKILGNWTIGAAPTLESVAVNLKSQSGAVESSKNRFGNCIFEKFAYAVISDWDVEFNQLSSCMFETLAYGVVFGEGIAQLGSNGQNTGPSHSLIENSQFLNVSREAILVSNGKFNVSKNNRFVTVGTNQGSEVNAVYPVILYKTSSNKSLLDYFARTEALISGTDATVTYIPEIEGTAQYELSYEHVQSFGRLQNVRLFRLPGVQNQNYELDYTIVSNTYRAIRSGTMSVTVDAIQDNVEVTDIYDYVGDNDFITALDFTGRLRDTDNDGAADTIDIRVTSRMPNDDESTIKFTIKAKKTDTP
jgi:hypothetical protein